jgi:hypothetical protein
MPSFPVAGAIFTLDDVGKAKRLLIDIEVEIEGEGQMWV